MSANIRRALLSVSNKEGLLDFARALRERGVAILSTGDEISELGTPPHPARIYNSNAWMLAAQVTDLVSQPGFAQTFLPRGRAPTVGELFRMPAAARMLERFGGWYDPPSVPLTTPCG